VARSLCAIFRAKNDKFCAVKISCVYDVSLA
jgi:hypothetical protein